MKTVRLIAKSRHGKNIINGFGDTWIVAETRATVECKPGCGTCMKVVPARSDAHDVRWVAEKDDPDFELVTT